MQRSSLHHVRNGLLGLAMLTTIASGGCRSHSSSLGPSKPSPDVTNVVQKPTYQVPGTKPLFLGGYAGAFYGSSPLSGR
jgi:hypothetical protein